MENPRFIFTTPFNVNIVEEKGIERVFLEGLISTTDLDLVNDVVTKNCLESMQKQILDRNIKLDIEHESFRGETPEEKEINKTIIPIGKITDATVVDIGQDRFGLRIKSELNRHNPRFDEIKGSVLERYLDAYSIAFIPTKVAHVEKNGVMIRLLDDDRLLNVALTGNPVNTGALNQDVFLKALDAVEQYKKDKLKNPEIGDQLEVKALSKEQKKFMDDVINYMEEKLGIKLTSEQKSGINDHLRDTKLNYRRLKMKEDQKKDETSGEEGKPEGEQTSEPTETTETTETPETTDAPKTTETPDAPAEGEPAEGADAPTGEEGKSIDLKAITDKIGAVEKDVAEIKALLKKPVHKAHSETKKPVEQKAVEPLDAVK